MTRSSGEATVQVPYASRSTDDHSPSRAHPAYVFVLGSGRCGSTLVQEVLCRHPEVGFVSNVEDRFAVPAHLTRWNGLLYRRLPASVARKGPKRFVPSEAYRALDREVSPMLSAPFRDLDAREASPWLAARLHRFFGERAAAQQVTTFLHKFTGWPRAGLLHRVFPGARFIHIVRDGRAVANSLLQVPWWRGYGGPEHWQWGPLPGELAQQWEAADRSFAVLAGLQWRLLMDAHDRAREKLPAGCWLDVRYEDVTARPDASFREMLDFCGLESSDEFDRGLARHHIHESRTDAFRRELNADELESLTKAITPTLEAHGYVPE